MVNVWPSYLRAILEEAAPFAIAFSGGLDSRFLCHAAQCLELPFIACHAQGPHIPQRESQAARAWARKRGIDIKIIEFDPLQTEATAANDENRCYYCKKDLFSRILDYGRTVLDGTHKGDMAEYRPGLRALHELGILSPLAEAGLDKSAIRSLARLTGLDDWLQKARPCLLTRFAYGLKPSRELLARIAAAEEELRPLMGSRDFRLRLSPQPVLQIEELDEPFDARQAKTVLHKNGFAQCRILASPTVSGFFDQPPPAACDCSPS